MTFRTHYLAAAAAIGALAVPAAAQTAYPGYQYPQYQQPVPQPYPDQPGNGYNRGYSNLRVTSISDVQRRNNGLRVSGLMSSGYGGQYGSQYGSQDGYQ